jgi:hypothetical protein
MVDYNRPVIWPHSKLAASSEAVGAFFLQLRHGMMERNESLLILYFLKTYGI